jgi:hypothetical protein
MVEYEKCQLCDKVINSEEDAFTIVDGDEYQCWDCYCFPPGR